MVSGFSLLKTLFSLPRIKFSYMRKVLEIPHRENDSSATALQIPYQIQNKKLWT